MNALFLILLIVGIIMLVLASSGGKRKYRRPEVTGISTDWKGDTVVHIRADNYIDASDAQGLTTNVKGDKELVKVGPRQWEGRIVRRGLSGETRSQSVHERIERCEVVQLRKRQEVDQ